VHVGAVSDDVGRIGTHAGGLLAVPAT
jgi:hypothetical protein